MDILRPGPLGFHAVSRGMEAVSSSEGSGPTASAVPNRFSTTTNHATREQDATCTFETSLDFLSHMWTHTPQGDSAEIRRNGAANAIIVGIPRTKEQLEACLRLAKERWVTCYPAACQPFRIVENPKDEGQLQLQTNLVHLLDQGCLLKGRDACHYGKRQSPSQGAQQQSSPPSSNVNEQSVAYTILGIPSSQKELESCRYYLGKSNARVTLSPRMDPFKISMRKKCTKTTSPRSQNTQGKKPNPNGVAKVSPPCGEPRTDSRLTPSPPTTKPETMKTSPGSGNPATQTSTQPRQISPPASKFNFRSVQVPSIPQQYISLSRGKPKKVKEPAVPKAPPPEKALDFAALNQRLEKMHEVSLPTLPAKNGSPPSAVPSRHQQTGANNSVMATVEEKRRADQLATAVDVMVNTAMPQSTKPPPGGTGAAMCLNKVYSEHERASEDVASVVASDGTKCQEERSSAWTKVGRFACKKAPDADGQKLGNPSSGWKQVEDFASTRLPAADTCVDSALPITVAAGVSEPSSGHQEPENCSSNDGDQISSASLRQTDTALDASDQRQILPVTLTNRTVQVLRDNCPGVASGWTTPQEKSSGWTKVGRFACKKAPDVVSQPPGDPTSGWKQVEDVASTRLPAADTCVSPARPITAMGAPEPPSYSREAASDVNKQSGDVAATSPDQKVVIVDAPGHTQSLPAHVQVSKDEAPEAANSWTNSHTQESSGWTKVGRFACKKAPDSDSQIPADPGSSWKQPSDFSSTGQPDTGAPVSSAQPNAAMCSPAPSPERQGAGGYLNKHDGQVLSESLNRTDTLVGISDHGDALPPHFTARVEQVSKDEVPEVASDRTKSHTENSSGWTKVGRFACKRAPETDRLKPVDPVSGREQTEDLSSKPLPAEDTSVDQVLPMAGTGSSQSEGGSYDWGPGWGKNRAVRIQDVVR